MYMNLVYRQLTHEPIIPNGHFGLPPAEINEVSMGKGENSLLNWRSESKAQKRNQVNREKKGRETSHGGSTAWQ